MPTVTAAMPTELARTADSDGDVSLAETVETGTIVQDKKVEHRGFWGAVQENWEDRRQRRAARQAAQHDQTPTVTRADNRLDKLRAAAVQSYQAPQGDHDALLQQVKDRATTTAPKNSLTVKQVTETTPTWNHVVQKEQPTQPKPPTNNAPTSWQPPIESITHERVTDQKRTSNNHTAPQTSTTTQPTPGTKRIPTPTAATSSTPTAPTKTTKAKLQPQPTIAQTATSPTRKTTTSATAVPQPTLTTQTRKQSPTASAPKTTPANTKRTVDLRSQVSDSKPRLSSKLLLGIATILFITGLSGGGVWYYTQNQNNLPTPTAAVQQSLINADETITVPVTSDSENVLTTVYNNMLGSATLRAHTFTNGAGALADPTLLITNMNLRVSGAFGRSLTALTAGSINGTDPFIVLRATDFDTAFAGMLSWEQSMTVDLSPLFGTPVSESFDETARTSNQVRSSFFKDIIVANTSARVLVDETNTQRILYGFVTPNTILITVNEDVYTRLLPHINR